MLHVSLPVLAGLRFFPVSRSSQRPSTSGPFLSSSMMGRMFFRSRTVWPEAEAFRMVCTESVSSFAKCRSFFSFPFSRLFLCSRLPLRSSRDTFACKRRFTVPMSVPLPPPLFSRKPPPPALIGSSPVFSVNLAVLAPTVYWFFFFGSNMTGRNFGFRLFLLTWKPLPPAPRVRPPFSDGYPPLTSYGSSIFRTPSFDQPRLPAAEFLRNSLAQRVLSVSPFSPFNNSRLLRGIGLISSSLYLYSLSCHPIPPPLSRPFPFF